MKDFFISYNGKDKSWAEWIAYQLEEAGYTTIIQAWDFRPGGNFVLEMQKAATGAERTLAVLSQNYLDAEYTQPEWAEAFARDPQGNDRALVPVRIAPCELTGFLKPIVYVDLVGKDEAAALITLLDGVKTGRAKPLHSPPFPGQQAPDQTSTRPKPGFPQVLDENPETPSNTISATRVPQVSANQIKEKGIHIFIGDAGFKNEASIALVGCVILEDVQAIKQRLEKIREDLLHDPMIRQIAGIEIDLRKNGFTYLKDDPEIRTKFIENLRELLFEAYVCSADKKFLDSTARNENKTFRRLLGRLMYERLQANKSRPIQVWIAAKCKQHVGQVRKVIASQVLAISQNTRTGLSVEPAVHLSSSADLCSSMADYVCHLVLNRIEDHSSLQARDFEKIRSKVRVVHRFDTDEFFTRKNPLP